MFSGNPKLEKGVKVMNSIEDSKFPLLLNRIATSLSSHDSPKPFTDAEETKLETSLEITKADVRALIDSILEIFKVSAYYMIKPGVLHEQLEKVLELKPKKSEIFVQVWSSSAKAVVDNLKQKAYLPQLDHISYTMSMETYSNELLKEKLPKMQLQLGLSCEKEREDVNIEFNHQELYEFYNSLEQIQSQLDALR